MLRLPEVGYVWCPVIVISGFPAESFPSVFSVGPGMRMTYGTDTKTLTATATRVATPAMSNVRERRDMRGRLRAADPLGGAVGEALVLPDRHGRLQLVNQRAAGLERLGPVPARHPDDARQATDPQPPDPVHRGQRDDLIVLGDALLGAPAQFRLRRWVRAVAQPGHAPVFAVLPKVVVPDHAEEQRDPPGRRVHDRGSHLIHRQLAVTDGDQPDLAHPITVPRCSLALAPHNPL